MVSNQDGLGTDSFPEETFWPVHNFILQTLEGEGITFDDQKIDPHFPEDKHPNRKPGIGMLTEYINNPDYDIAGSYVIGDRESDEQLAQNLGCKALILGKDGMTWPKIAELLFAGERTAQVRRTTKETDIDIRLNLDGTGKCNIETGLGFFDHMLEQIGKHGMIDLYIHTVIVCLWTTVFVKWLLILADVPGLYGMLNSIVKRLVKCPQRCSSISSRVSLMRLA